MEEEYSRRNQQRPASASKSTIVTVILLLLINTLVLGLLLYLNVQANSKQEAQFNNLERQVSKLDQGANTPAPATNNTEHNVPVKESSTQISKAKESSSTTESSSQPAQTPPSSEALEQQTDHSTEPSQAANPAATSYTVQPGDTLSVIAEKNKLSLQDLMLKNNLTDSTVYIGQVLSLQ